MKTLLLTIAVLIGISIFGLKSCNTAVLEPSTAALSIEKVLADPSELHGETITVRGTVGNRFAIGGLGYFMLEEKGFKILILSKGGSPQIGDIYDVKGKVNQGFALNDREHVAIIEESRTRRE